MNEYQKGRELLDRGELTAAKTNFQAGAAKNDPKCVYGLLAVAAMAGERTDAAQAHMKEVAGALMEMANSEDAEACFIVGRCSETGCGMPQDMITAVAYYSRAASLGNMDAMFNLGCFYMLQGPEGKHFALECFQKAAANGNREAAIALEHHNTTCKKEG